MTAKEHFTDDEWASILQAPMLAGLAVTAADPGGLWGAIKEGAGIARSLAEAKAGGDAGSLVSEVGAAFDSADGRRTAQEGVKALVSGKKPAEVTAAAVVRLGEIKALVDAKAPAQSTAFKAFLKTTAQTVAEAGTEGGFLGFGGEKVSDAEKKTLADIDRVLG
jgi:hypothetical protein